MPKKTAIPQKSNLTVAMEQLRALEDIPPLTHLPEYALLERMLGKNTIQATRIIRRNLWTDLATYQGRRIGWPEG